jgi:hypothetical protein
MPVNAAACRARNRDELAQLRRENRRLREDVEILKRATAEMKLLLVAERLDARKHVGARPRRVLEGGYGGRW